MYLFVFLFFTQVKSLNAIIFGRGFMDTGNNVFVFAGRD